MGNCGFSIAPVKRKKAALVVRNLERAEDISAAAMAAGIEWGWETFTEYLDFVEGNDFGDSITLTSTYSGTQNVLGRGGNDTIVTGISTQYIDGGEGNDDIDARLSTSIQYITGGAGSDTLSEIENLTGSGFNDTLTGDGNANRLSGGAGNDTLNGGAGNDTYVVDQAGDSGPERPRDSVALLSGHEYRIGGAADHGRPERAHPREGRAIRLSRLGPSLRPAQGLFRLSDPAGSAAAGSHDTSAAGGSGGGLRCPPA